MSTTQTVKVENKCFACMETIRGKPIEVYVRSDDFHSSYFEVSKKEGGRPYRYGYLKDDERGRGILFLHPKEDASEQYPTAFGEGWEYCSECGVTFDEDGLNMRDYEESGDVRCPDCQSIEGSVLTPKDFPLNPTARITAHVFADYDALDTMAEKAGFKATEPSEDEKVDDSGLIAGFDNLNLHCGWIALMGDSSHNVEDMIELLNRKVELIKSRNQDFIVGFSQTGHFSVGYSIYVKA